MPAHGIIGLVRWRVGLAGLVAVSLACGAQPQQAAAPATPAPTSAAAASAPDATSAEATAAADATAATQAKTAVLRSLSQPSVGGSAIATPASQAGRAGQSSPLPGANDPDWLTYQHDL